MIDATKDSYVVVCNYAEHRGVASQGAKAYLSQIAGDAERAEVVVRSRGGRHVAIWVPVKALTNVRVKTLPPEAPVRELRAIFQHETKDAAQKMADWLNSILSNLP